MSYFSFHNKMSCSGDRSIIWKDILPIKKFTQSKELSYVALHSSHDVRTIQWVTWCLNFNIDHQALQQYQNRFYSHLQMMANIAQKWGEYTRETDGSSQHRISFLLDRFSFRTLIVLIFILTLELLQCLDVMPERRVPWTNDCSRIYVI